LSQLALLEGEAAPELAAPRFAGRMGLFDRLGQRMLKLGRAQRTVLVFDDIHRFDRASRDFLPHFFRHVSVADGPQGGGLLRALVTYDPAELVDDPLRDWLEAES